MRCVSQALEHLSNFWRDGDDPRPCLAIDPQAVRSHVLPTKTGQFAKPYPCRGDMGFISFDARYREELERTFQREEVFRTFLERMPGLAPGDLW